MVGLVERLNILFFDLVYIRSESLLHGIFIHSSLHILISCAHLYLGLVHLFLGSCSWLRASELFLVDILSLLVDTIVLGDVAFTIYVFLEACQGSS